MSTFKESLSLAETNAVRISLGLKPLSEDSPPADDADTRAEGNMRLRKEAEAKEKSEREVRERVAK